MGFFDKFEKLSEKYIEGFFKSKFANHIQPAEIAKILLREMRDNKNVSVSVTYVPNEYVVSLGQEDWEKLQNVRMSLSKELGSYLLQKSKEKNYQVVGDISVIFQLDTELSLGSIGVESRFAEKPEEKILSPGSIKDPVKEAADKKESTLIVSKDLFYTGDQKDLSEGKSGVSESANNKIIRGELIQRGDDKAINRFPIGEQGVIIGRRRINEIYLSDSNVSRTHASIEFTEGSHYITDLGSTNGTFVNGTRISRAKLSHGDLVKIGATVLEYRKV